LTGIFLQTYPQNQFTCDSASQVTQALQFFVLQYDAGESGGRSQKAGKPAEKQMVGGGSWLKLEIGPRMPLR
jgi:hypothetical protein